MSDVYSFGVLSFEVFSAGQYPFANWADEVLALRLATLQTSEFATPLFGRLTSTLPPPVMALAVAWLCTESKTRPPAEVLVQSLHPQQWPLLARV